MGYNYNIATSKKDEHANRGLAVCHTLATIIDLFLSTFLIAHLYAFSTDAYNYCFKAALFELTGYLVMMVVYWLSSLVVNKTNRIWVYRVALFLRAAVVVFSVFYGKQIAKFVWLAGVLNGFSKGVYWSSYNVLKQEMVSRNSIKSFSVLTYVLQQCCNVIFPITLGALIEISTFSQVAIYVLVICAVQIGVSFAVHAQRPENSNFNVAEYLKRLRQNPEVYFKIKSVYKISALYGTTSVLTTLMNVCIMLQFGSNFSLGAITSAISLAIILTAICFNKFTKEGKRGVLYLVASILPLIGVAIFTIMPSMLTIVVFNFSTATTGVLFKVQFDILRNRDLKEAGLYQDIAEHQAVIEYILCFVRSLTYALVLLLSFSNSQIVFNIMLVLFTVLYIANLVAMFVYEKHYKTQITNNKSEMSLNDSDNGDAI